MNEQLNKRTNVYQGNDEKTNSPSTYQSSLKSIGLELLGSSPQMDQLQKKKLGQGYSYQSKSFGPDDVYGDLNQQRIGGNGATGQMNNLNSIRKPRLDMQSSSLFQKGDNPNQTYSNNDILNTSTQQLQSYRDNSVDRIRANLDSSSGNNNNNSSDLPYKNKAKGILQNYRQNAHSLGNHGASFLKNHIGQKNLIIPDTQNNNQFKASLNGGLGGLPVQSKNSSFKQKTIFQDTNIFSSPQIDKSKMGKLDGGQGQQSSILANIQPVSIEKQFDKTLQSGQASQININNSPYNQNLSLTLPAQQNSSTQSTNNNASKLQQRPFQDRQTFANQELDSFLRDDRSFI